VNREREELLAREQLKFEKVKIEDYVPPTKEEEIKNLDGLIECMREFEHYTEEELDKIKKQWIKEIEEKYSTQ